MKPPPPSPGRGASVSAPPHRGTAPRHAPAPWPVFMVLTAGSIFASWRGASMLPGALGDDVPSELRALLLAQWLVETVFAFGIAGSVVVALAYLFGRERAAPVATGAPPHARVAIVYLCCGDLDRVAVASLRRLQHDGLLELWIHDDLPGGDRAVDALAVDAQGDGGVPVRVWRRPERTGGKPGAVNWMLARLAGSFDFVLLCDNDSVAVDPAAVTKLLAPMSDSTVAVVQARNVPVLDPSQCTVNRAASRAVDVFDLFLEVGSRFAWMPFVGHNALLRLDAVRAVGGMQAGCFADDIDLTLRLQLAGSRVHYAQDVAFGERHPPSYAAFRKRAYKWACGSAQVLKRWTPRVLCSRLSLAEKWGYLQFLGFFPLQALALVYTALTFLVAPLVLARDERQLAASMLAGCVLPLLIFLPVLAYALRSRWTRGLAGFLTTCWACYGAADVPTARGVLHGLSSRPRRWVPTNSVRGGTDRSMFQEAFFGAALLVVPLGWHPELLLSPLAFLVAGKFLLIPAMGELYQDGVRAPHATSRVRERLGGLLRIGALLAVTGTLLAQEPAAPRVAIEVRGDQLWVAGQPYVVKGVHYGPWRPGCGPGRSPPPARADLDADLALVASLNANTVLAFDPTRDLLDSAHAHGLLVLYGFWLEWPQFASPAFAAAEDAAVARAAELHEHPAVLGWVLGNEIPTWVVTQHGADVVAGRLRDLRERLRAVDARHPVTHANWPTTRTLDLSFLDLCAFNVYALWPPEVVARGYGAFVRDVLRPLAKGRPLLITEFGANALEAGPDGQARLVRECWDGLRDAGAIGGFAFEFADEWWKNYSNPKMSGAWWDRDVALDDHLRHDEDPEEHYGLFDGERRPKAAAVVVQSMYGRAGTDAGALRPADGPRSRPTELVVAVIVAAALLYALTAALRRHDRRSAARTGAPPPNHQTTLEP